MRPVSLSVCSSSLWPPEVRAAHFRPLSSVVVAPRPTVHPLPSLARCPRNSGYLGLPGHSALSPPSSAWVPLSCTAAWKL